MDLLQNNLKSPDLEKNVSQNSLCEQVALDQSQEASIQVNFVEKPIAIKKYFFIFRDRSHFRKIAGLAVLIIGAVFVMYAIHLMQTTHEAKQNVSKIANPALEEPLSAIVGDVLNKKVGEKDVQQAYFLIGAMVVLLGGGGILLYYHSKR